MDPALHEVMSEAEGGDQIEALIRLTEDVAAVPDVQLVSRFGSIATCRLPRDSVFDVRASGDVESLKAARLLKAEKDITSDGDQRDAGTWNTADERRPAGLRATGKGVVIGVLDWGADVRCAAFRNADGSSRLRALWDQRGPPDPRQPNRYGYGRFHKRNAISAALRTPDPYAALGYHPADADSSRTGSHGTHVMDIAAGNGRAGGPLGVAPGADLVFVHLATSKTAGLANLGDSVHILEAIDFVRRTAGHQRWIANLSVGRHGGPHDGTTLVEMALDEVLGGPHGCVVQSAGNYFDKQIHTAGVLMAGQSATLRAWVDEADITPNELEVWYPGTDEYWVSLECPRGYRSRWVSVQGREDVFRGGRLVARIYHRRSDPNNLDNQIDIFIYPGAPAGEWRIRLRAHRTRTHESVFHGWLERDDACPRCQTRFHLDDANSFWTTGTLANSKYPLVVGAYDSSCPNRCIAPFSSGGPTRDGRRKPDLLAPGMNVVAARSASRHAASDEPLLTRKSGTSMAAPHVTGCAALLLEVSGGRLTQDDLRELILSNTDNTFASVDDAERRGYGYLNVAKAVDAASRIGRRATYVNQGG